MGLVGGAPLLVLIAPHLCRRQQSMPPFQRADPVPTDANSASCHASRRGLASEGGSRTPDEASFEGHAFPPRIKRTAKRSYSERPSSTSGLAGRASDRSTPTPLRQNHRAMNE